MAKKKGSKGASCKRTMDLYRYLEYKVWKTEHWCHFSQRRKDLLGIFDVLAFDECNTIGVQDTTWGQTSARRRKILASPWAYDWLLNQDRRIQIVGWKSPEPDKGRHKWEHKIIEITLDDFKDGRPEVED